MSLPTANESKINDAEQQPPDIIFDSIYTKTPHINVPQSSIPPPPQPSPRIKKFASPHFSSNLVANSASNVRFSSRPPVVHARPFEEVIIDPTVFGESVLKPTDDTSSWTNSKP